LCKEIQRWELSLWRGESVKDNSVDYVYSPNGLFPIPMSYDDQLNGLTPKLYRDIGKLVAKSLMDSRLVYNNILKNFNIKRIMAINII